MLKTLKSIEPFTSSAKKNSRFCISRCLNASTLLWRIYKMTVEIPVQYTHSVKLLLAMFALTKWSCVSPTNPEEPSGNSGSHLQHPFANVPDGHFSQWVPT